MADEIPKNPKHISPQDTIDTFWDQFDSKTPGIASTILPQNIYAKKASDSRPQGVVAGQSVVTGYEEAVELCKTKVEKIVKECKRINQKYRDAHFDIEFDLKWGRRDCLESLAIPNKKKSDFKPQSAKRVSDIFDAPQFYIRGATVDDIRQGRNGDCWFMAALCVLGNKQSLIEQVCVARDEQIGVYGFVFHRDGEWRSEIIDDKLYLSKPDYDESFLERLIWDDRERISSEEEYRKAYQSNSGALYFAQCEDPNETWLPLLEKAYAKAHGDFSAIEGGFPGEGIEDLTGGVTTEIFTTDILDKEYFWKEELMRVNEDFLFSCCTGLFKGWGERKGIQEGHSYSIMKAVEMDGERLVLLKNPWGRGEWTGPWSDGSKEWTASWLAKLEHRFGNNGAFWISFQDLMRKYQSFDRTRIFAAEWNLAQQWTTVQVPWTVDYMDTKFEVVLESDAPVLIVLSQLDGRYFRGFEGQYRYELWFRVHRAGEEEYIVRSHENYCMRRSVSVELQLEAGTYQVLLCVRAERDTCCADPVERVVKDNCKSRPDKILRVGLSYDLAHSKGQIVESEEEKAGKEALEARKNAKEQEDWKAKLTKSKRRAKHLEKKSRRKTKAKDAKEGAKAVKKASNLEDEVGKQREQTAQTANLKLVKVPKDAQKALGLIKEGSITFPERSAPPKADDPNFVGVTPVSSSEDQVTIAAAQTQLRPLSTGEVPPTNGVTNSSYNDVSDDDSEASTVTTGTIAFEIEQSKNSASEPTKCQATPACCLKPEEETEFQHDPWNAWCVIGLRVYSKEAKATVQVIRPKTWEDGETSLDVDDSAADATKHAVPASEFDKPVELDGEAVASIAAKTRKSCVMGVPGRLGSTSALWEM